MSCGCFPPGPCSRLTTSHSMAGVAAATVMERNVYLDLGGFDPAYKEGYWEDVDLAVRVRQAGLDVFLQPLSIVYHQEGGTFEATSDSAASLSRKDQLMAANGAIFRERCVCQTLLLDPASLYIVSRADAVNVRQQHP